MDRLKNRFDMFNYTKLWTTIILLCCVLWISASFVLAAFGKEKIAESLASDVVGLTKAIFCTYIIRAFFDTYAEKNYYLKLYKECQQSIREKCPEKQSEETEDDSIEL